MMQLGTLFLFRVPVGMYRRDVIVSAMTEHGLAIAGKRLVGGKAVEHHEVPYMPPTPSDSDIFRKSVSEAVKPWRKLKDDLGRRVNVRVVDVPTRSEIIHREIIQEIVGGRLSNHFDDISGEQLKESDIQTIAKVIWNPHSLHEFTIALTHSMEEAVTVWAPGINYIDLLNEMQNLVRGCRDLISDCQLRDFITDTILHRFNGRVYSEVRGTYFSQDEQIHDFALALREIDGVFAQCVMLYDEGTVKADLQAHSRQRLESEAQRIVGEIDTVKGSRRNKLKRIGQEIERCRQLALEVEAADIVDLLTLAETKLKASDRKARELRERRAAARELQKEKDHARPQGLFGLK